MELSGAIVEYEAERRISKSGGTAVLYLPKEAKQYVSPGDKVRVMVTVTGSEVRIIASKQLYNFSLEDVRGLTRKGFEIEYDKNLGGVLVYSATNGSISLSYTQSLRDKMAPGYVTVSRKFQNLDPDKHKQVTSLATKLRRKFDVLIRSEGDLDTVNLLKEPERYHLHGQKAFELLQKAGREVGLSISLRFDNRHDKIEQVRAGLEELDRLDTKL